MIHRDLKPSNILLSGVGPRVIDFGIARLEDAQTQLTNVGGVVGTLAYMAPEQLRGGPITPAVDLFAWAGLVTYAATGRPPFGTGGDLKERILNDEPNIEEFEEPLRELVRSAFVKDPTRRPSAADLVERLSRSRPAMATRVLETAAIPPAAPPPEPDVDEADTIEPSTVRTAKAAAERPARTWRKLSGAALLVLIVGMVPGILWLARGDGHQGFGTLLHTMTDHSSDVYAVAVGTVNHRTIAVSGSADKTVRIWDLATGKQVGEPFNDHEDTVNGVAIGERNHRPVIASASSGLGGRGFLGLKQNDNAVRVWDPVTREEFYRLPHNEGYAGHGPADVAIGSADGRPIVVSAAKDLRVWNLANGRPLGKPVTLSTSGFSVLDDRTVVAVAACPGDGKIAPDCPKGSAFLWDAGAEKQVGKTFTGDRVPAFTAAAGQLNSRPIVVADTRGAGNELCVWDVTTGKQVGKPLTGHTGNVFSIAVGRLNGRAIAVSGGVDQMIRVWDLATSREIGKPLKGHKGIVESVALGTLNGRPIVVSGGEDDTVRVWDLGPPYPAASP